MSEISTQAVYFMEAGDANRERTLELAGDRAKALGIRQIVVATTSGETGVRAVQMLKGFDVVVVSHSQGYQGPNTQELEPQHRKTIEAASVPVLTCQHALGGVNRAVRRQFNTYQTDEIIAQTLRIFGQGMKVCLEIAMMAADAGLVVVGEPAICVAGTNNGADTAVILQPANAQAFFDFIVLEIICMPSPAHPGSA